MSERTTVLSDLADRVRPGAARQQLIRHALSMAESFRAAREEHSGFMDSLFKIAQGQGEADEISTVAERLGALSRLFGDSARTATNIKRPEAARSCTEIRSDIDSLVQALQSGAFETIDGLRTNLEAHIGQLIWNLAD